MNNVRSLMIAILTLLGTPLLGSSVRAADYSVDFGIETDAGKDGGSLACLFNDVCGARIESLGLRVTVYAFRNEPGRASVRLYSGDLSCCYFAGAADSIAVDPRKPVSRVPIFKGASARGGLYIENERVGTLYLRFYSR